MLEEADEDTEPFMSTKAIVISAIVGANLFIGIFGFIFYRRFMKKRKLEAEKEDQALLAEVAAAQNKAKKKEAPKPKPVAEEPVEDELTAEADKISDMLDELDVGGEDDTTGGV